MQRRNFKDAMNEMCDHTVAKIQEHVETLRRLDKEQKGELLKFGGVEMNTDYPRTILYAILNRVVQDFAPRNENYKEQMDKVLKALETKEDPFAIQKEMITKMVNEAVKKKIHLSCLHGKWLPDDNRGCKITSFKGGY